MAGLQALFGPPSMERMPNLALEIQQFSEMRVDEE
jgi:hypothetical protein